MRSVSRDNATFLQLDSAKEVDVAVLDQTTARALSAVAEISGCEVDLFLSGTEFRSLRNNFKSGKRIQFAILAQFCGPPQAADEVGRILSKARLYLQDPIPHRQGVSRYDNPHRLNFGDSADTITPRPDAHSLLNDHEQEFETILRNLDHNAELTSETPTSAIVTAKLNL